MNPINPLGILFALTSAIVWGGGDFAGGYATRRSSQFQVLASAALSGLVVLILAMVLWRESLPSVRGVVWATLAGFSGALGISAFYRALSMGYTASIAPTTAVIGAALPVVVSAVFSGLPALNEFLGFGLAFLGIWMVSAAHGNEGRVSPRAMFLACLAGIGFGGFMIFLGQVEHGKIFSPLVIARCLTLLTGLFLIRIKRLPFLPLAANPTALLAGVLDAGGNLFYILAKQYTRLDIAAVLTSLYPASTVLLASILLKEKVTRRQGIGLLVCLAAIGMITI